MTQMRNAIKHVIQIHNKHEEGQVIVLVALFMIVMLAMVGVAIDGGGLFLLYRDAQNAADTAALQAAYDKCTGGTTSWQQTGVDAGMVNGFDMSEVTLGTENIGGRDYVKATIVSIKPAYFIQLVYPWDLVVEAEALVYCSGMIDMGNLPGIFGMGGCTCANRGGGGNGNGGGGGGNGNGGGGNGGGGGGNGGPNNNGSDMVDVSVATLIAKGDIHSNCGAKLNSTPGHAAAGGSLDGDASASNAISTNMSDVDDTNIVAPLPVPDEIPISLYFPGGEIYEKIKNTRIANGDAYDGIAVHHPNGWTVGSNEVLEGLHAVTGDFNIGSFSGNFGPRGVTVVATGTIYTEGGSWDTKNWAYYGYNEGQAGVDPGVMVEWTRGTGSGIALYSGIGPVNPDADCSVALEVGIDFQAGGENPGVNNTRDWDYTGMIYAPRSEILSRNRELGIRGGILAWRLNFQGSRLNWEEFPEVQMPMGPVMNNVR